MHLFQLAGVHIFVIITVGIEPLAYLDVYHGETPSFDTIVQERQQGEYQNKIGHNQKSVITCA